MAWRGRRSERSARQWPPVRPSWWVCAAILAAAAVLAPVLVRTQQGSRAASSSAPAATPIQQAQRALAEGRYDEVDRLVGSLDARDPAVVAVRGRALIARGRYADAEKLLAITAAHAPSSDAALELGLLQQMLGRPDARATLQQVVMTAGGQSASDLARVARALRALGRFQDANATYRDAAAAAPKDAAIQAAWGDLFLEKYNNREAAKSYEAALALDARSAPALLGMARTLADENPPQAVAAAERALQINPQYVDARVFLAGQAADAGRIADARDELQKALAVNPASLDALAQLAALDYVQDKPADFEATAAKALAIAPGDSEVFRAAGELAAHNYRFDEAVALTRRALALDATDAQSLADLGTHLLRTGDEPGARAALDAAFKIDPYNVVTYNLLGMMDTVDKFTTVRDGDLIVRMPADQADVLRPYAVPLAHKALATFADEYQFQPKGPILIEIFGKHDDFAVRNVGLPGMIGALGACFGRVVTMDSPKAPGVSTFLWEATLWHELAHVVTLQMSNQRVPRWLTEGISEYEEKRAHPEWARPMELQYALLLNANKTIKLHDLNAAFQDPNRITLGYFEASLVVQHLVDTYGIEGLRKLLRAYGLGLDTDAALKSALDTNLDALQAGFDTSVEKWFGGLRRALAGPAPETLGPMPLDALQSMAAAQAGSYPVQVAYARALRQAGQTDEAMKVYERAAKLVPIARGDDSPHAQMAAIALEKGDRARAVAELQALIAVDADNIAAARQLRDLMKQSNAGAAALAPVYERIAAIDPFDGEAHTALGRLALQRNDTTSATREFQVALALAPVDQASALTDLAESYFRGGQRADAKKQTLAALEIAPTYQRAQDLLLQLAGDGR